MKMKRVKRENRKSTFIDSSSHSNENEYEEVDIKEPKKEESNTNGIFKTFKLIPQLFKNKVFIFSVLSLSSLSFVITAIQFWGSDYMENVLKVEKATVNYVFIIICLTAPTLGVFIGGAVTSCLGGYEKMGASYLCLIGAFSATLMAIPIPFMDTLAGFASFLYGVLVFGGIIFPSIYGKIKYLFLGIIISSVSHDHKTAASSLAVIIMNLLGYIPAPFFYGFVNDLAKSRFPKLSMSICLYYSITGFIWMLLSVIFRKREFKAREESEALLANISDEMKNISETKNQRLQSKDKLTLAEVLKDKPSTISFAMLYQNFNPSDIPEASEYSEDEDNKILELKNRRSFTLGQSSHIKAKSKAKQVQDDELILEKKITDGNKKRDTNRSNSQVFRSTTKDNLLSESNSFKFDKESKKYSDKSEKIEESIDENDNDSIKE